MMVTMSLEVFIIVVVGVALTGALAGWYYTGGAE